MRFLNFSFLLALLLSTGLIQAQTALVAGTWHYTIYQNDKAVGTTDAMVTPTPAGYAITSRGELHLSKFSYSFENSQKLDHMLNLVSGQITGTVNGSPVTFAVSADSTGREFHIDVNAKGKQTQNTVDRHQHLALLADLDAAAFTVLTRIGMENPPVSWVLIPKETGLLVPSVYQRDADVPGTLNGATITVQHTTVTISAQNAVNVELFYTPDGRVLEADLPEQNFSVVLNGFKLTERPKFAPPRGSEANSPEQNGSPQYPPQQYPPQQYPPQYPAPQGGPPQLQQ